MQKHHYGNLQEERETEMSDYNQNIPMGQPIHPYPHPNQYNQHNYHLPPPPLMQFPHPQQVMHPPPPPIIIQNTSPVRYNCLNWASIPTIIQRHSPAPAANKQLWASWTSSQVILPICGVHLSDAASLPCCAAFPSWWTPASTSPITARTAAITSFASIRSAVNLSDADRW